LAYLSLIIKFQHAIKYANDAEKCLQQAVSVYCFSFLSEGLKTIGLHCNKPLNLLYTCDL